MTSNTSAGSQAIEAIVRQLGLSIRAGNSPDEAARLLVMMGVHEDQVREGLEAYRRQTKKIWSLREPGGIIDSQLESWYAGPQEGDKFWPAFEKHLALKGWSEEAIRSLDDASTKVVSLLRPPGAGTIQTRGLVVGYVQSGKTANFTAVISKAADVNYRLFIVLSGINNSLRNQTQARLDADTVALNPSSWVTITDPTHDFRRTGNVDSFLGGEAQGLKILGVIKKNKFRLDRLLDWLKRARPETLRNCPILIIDDEADQASPNSAKLEAERTAINKLLVELLKALPKAAYVGYTATPFANFLIDPSIDEDLYPRDFIVDLPTPANYFGTEKLFGRPPLDWEDPDAGSDGMDIIREVPANEIPLLRPVGRQEKAAFHPKLAPSLRASLRYFLMAAAARRFRGQKQEHCSMLIHTSEYTAVQDAFEAPLKKEIATLAQLLARNDVQSLEDLRDQWAEEQGKFPSSEVSLVAVAFHELRPELPGVLRDVEVKLEHGVSSNRIDYDTPGRLYVVVGGNVLARGLTIEGLTVSFFVRSGSAYDTLLQMGRWFGFRFGYADLPRLWMTAELRLQFEHLAIVEREIRHEIDRYKDKRFSPRDFGPRIRSHPHLAITSKLKMQHARTAEMSFAGKTPQTTVFKHKDFGWLAANLNATRQLISRIRMLGFPPRKVVSRANIMFFDVPAGEILTFLSEYQIHADHIEMPSKLLLSYIRAQNDKGRLLLWNVGLVTSEQGGRHTLDVGLDSPIALLTRSLFDRREDADADIKALMSEFDYAADVDVNFGDLRERKRRDILDERDERVPDRGMLLLYPIDMHSAPKPGRDRKRKKLGAVAHVIGIALVFPNPDDNTPQSYVTVAIPDNVDVDELELEEDTDE
jgi:hypothetical protein